MSPLVEMVKLMSSLLPYVEVITIGPHTQCMYLTMNITRKTDISLPYNKVMNHLHNDYFSKGNTQHYTVLPNNELYKKIICLCIV